MKHCKRIGLVAALLAVGGCCWWFTSQLSQAQSAVSAASAKVATKKVDAPPFVEPFFDEKEAKKQQEEWATKLKAPVETENKLGLKMVLIPPAGPALPKAYYLGKYAVTQGEWEKVLRYNPSAFSPKGFLHAKVAGLDTSRFPVENVSWFDCVEFCNKLSELEGLKSYYDLKVKRRGGKDSPPFQLGDGRLIKMREDEGSEKQIEDAEVKILGGGGYHMPTNAQWEHGCRAGTKTKYYFGDKDEDLPDYAWFGKNSEGRTHAVGEKKPNRFGLYDMLGNVRQWTEDPVGYNPYAGAPEYLVRGGASMRSAGLCTVSGGYSGIPGMRGSTGTRGLRVSREP